MVKNAIAGSVFTTIQIALFHYFTIVSSNTIVTFTYSNIVVIFKACSQDTKFVKIVTIYEITIVTMVS